MALKCFLSVISLCLSGVFSSLFTSSVFLPADFQLMCDLCRCHSINSKSNRTQLNSCISYLHVIFSLFFTTGKQKSNSLIKLCCIHLCKNRKLCRFFHPFYTLSLTCSFYDMDFSASGSFFPHIYSIILIVYI